MGNIVPKFLITSVCVMFFVFFKEILTNSIDILKNVFIKSLNCFEKSDEIVSRKAFKDLITVVILRNIFMMILVR